MRIRVERFGSLKFPWTLNKELKNRPRRLAREKNTTLIRFVE